MRTLTREDYDKLVHAFHQVPGNFFAASRLAGVCRATARRAWELGFPKRGWDPIKDVLAAEAAEVRRRMDEQEERERALAARERRLKPLVDGEAERRSSVKRREEWAAACTAARRNSQLMLLTTNELLQAAYARAPEMKRKLLEDKSLSPAEYVKIVKELTSTGKAVSDALATTQQVERLALGQPTEIVGLQPMMATREEAIRQIERSQAAIERAMRKGKLPAGLPPGRVEDAEIVEAGSPGSSLQGAPPPEGSATPSPSGAAPAAGGQDDQGAILGAAAGKPPTTPSPSAETPDPIRSPPRKDEGAIPREAGRALERSPSTTPSSPPEPGQAPPPSQAPDRASQLSSVRRVAGRRTSSAP